MSLGCVAVLNFEIEPVLDAAYTVNQLQSERLKSDWYRFCHKKWIAGTDRVVWSVRFVSLVRSGQQIRERFPDWPTYFRIFAAMVEAFD